MQGLARAVVQGAGKSAYLHPGRARLPGPVSHVGRRAVGANAEGGIDSGFHPYDPSPPRGLLRGAQKYSRNS